MICRIIGTETINMIMLWDSDTHRIFNTDTLTWLYPDDIVLELNTENNNSYVLTTTGLVGWIASEFLKKV